MVPSYPTRTCGLVQHVEGWCRICKQEGEKKEPCSTRNVVYESECGVCNPAGSRKLADREGLAEKRDIPSLYVGETARSVMERAGEHWADGLAGKEESHMADHQAMAHEGEQPQFNFSVVKQCTSSLERQVREAVRVQMRVGLDRLSVLPIFSTDTDTDTDISVRI